MRVLKEIITNSNFFKEYERMKEIVLRYDTFYVVSHNDIDGISSACNLKKLFNRLRKKTFFLKIGMLCVESIERIAIDSLDYEVVIFSDLGSFFLEELKMIEKPVIVLDHHEIQGENESIIHINPLSFGEEGMQNCCAAVLTFLAYISVFEEDIGSCLNFLFAGILGDKQDYAPTQTTKRLLEYLEEKGHISSKKIPILKHGSLLKILTYSIFPFFEKIRFSKIKAKKSLETFGLSEDLLFEELTEEQLNNFNRLVIQECSKFRPSVKEIEFRPKYLLNSLETPAENILDLFRAFESSKFSISRFLDANPSSKRNVSLVRKYFSSLTPLLKYFFDPKKITHSELFSYAIVAKGPMAILGEVMHKYLSKKNKIFFLFKISSTNRIKFSSRADRDVVNQGINLSELCNKLGTSFGGLGGGHRIAAGGVTMLSSLEENIHFIESFLNKRKEIITALSP